MEAIVKEEPLEVDVPSLGSLFDPLLNVKAELLCPEEDGGSVSEAEDEEPQLPAEDLAAELPDVSHEGPCKDPHWTCPDSNEAGDPRSWPDYEGSEVGSISEHGSSQPGDWQLSVAGGGLAALDAGAGCSTESGMRGGEVFECGVCLVQFRLKINLDDHVSAHMVEDMYKYSCQECGKQFSHLNSLSRHMKIHTGEKPFECGVCSKRFSQYPNLIAHSRIHTGEKPFQCGVCGKRFTQSSALSTHKKIHTGEKPYQCEVCCKLFTHSSSLTAHRAAHTGEKPFPCGHCSKGFATFSDLGRHSRTHTGEKPFQCDECDRRFARYSHLTRHCRTHTGEKPFRCDVCGKRFATSTHLIRHGRTHTGEKPFHCKACDKQFTTSSHLNRHSRIHARV